MSHYVSHPIGAGFSLKESKARALRRGEEKQEAAEASKAASDARLAEREEQTALMKIAVPAALVLGVLYFASRSRK